MTVSLSGENISSHLIAFAVTTTTGLYWSMMESGLGLLAACLPTLYALVKTLSRGSSTRKAPTDFSNTGAASHNWPGSLYTSNHGRQDSMGSDVQIVSGAARPANIETHAMKDLTMVPDNSGHQTDRIWVKKTIERTENMV